MQNAQHKEVIDDLANQHLEPLLNSSVVSNVTDLVYAYGFFTDVMANNHAQGEMLRQCAVQQDDIIRIMIAKVRLTKEVLHVAEVTKDIVNEYSKEFTSGGIKPNVEFDEEKVVPVLDMNGKPVANVEEVNSSHSMVANAPIDDELPEDDSPEQLFTLAELKEDLLKAHKEGFEVQVLYDKTFDLLHNEKYVPRPGKKTHAWDKTEFDNWFFAFMPKIVAPVESIKTEPVKTEKSKIVVTVDIPTDLTIEERFAKFAMAYKTIASKDAEAAVTALQAWFKDHKFSDEVILEWADKIEKADLETESPYALLKKIEARTKKGGDATETAKPFQPGTPDEMAKWMVEQVRTNLQECTEPKEYLGASLVTKIRTESTKLGHPINLKAIKDCLIETAKNEFPEIYDAKFKKFEKPKIYIESLDTAAKSESIINQGEVETKTAFVISAKADTGTSQVEPDKIAEPVVENPIIASSGEDTATDSVILPETIVVEDEAVIETTGTTRPDWLDESEEKRLKDLSTMEGLLTIVKEILDEAQENKPYVEALVKYSLLTLNNIEDAKNWDSVQVEAFLKLNIFPSQPGESSEIQDAVIVEEENKEEVVETTETTETETVETDEPTTEEKDDSETDSTGKVSNRVDEEAMTREYTVNPDFSLDKTVVKLQAASSGKEFNNAIFDILSNIPSKEKHSDYVSVIFNAIQTSRGKYSKRMSKNKPGSIYKTIANINKNVISTQKHK